MNLKEHQAKHFLRGLGFQTPVGVHCDSAETAEALADTLQTDHWVVKAQILSGGRARGCFVDENEQPQGVLQQRGGIRFANSTQQIFELCQNMLGNTLITDHTGAQGEVVQSVYLEARCDVQAEYYLALTTDAEFGQLTFVVSREGGTDIEASAADNPSSVHKIPVPLDADFTAAEKICSLLEVPADQLSSMQACLSEMVAQFVEKDLRLIEINPLARVGSGQLIALDAVVVFDDNALFRQGHPEQMDAYSHLPEQEFLALAQGMNFVRLGGNIATLSSGAGLAMATIDSICENGGSPANFLDVPPSTAIARLQDAISLTLQDSRAVCLLVNIFGGGIMRCDAIADALLLVHRETPISIPLVVRLAGTNAELAKQRLSVSMPQARLVENLAEAAQLCCALASVKGEATTATSAIWQKIKRLVPDGVA